MLAPPLGMRSHQRWTGKRRQWSAMRTAEQTTVVLALGCSTGLASSAVLQRFGANGRTLALAASGWGSSASCHLM